MVDTRETRQDSAIRAVLTYVRSYVYTHIRDILYTRIHNSTHRMHYIHHRNIYYTHTHGIPEGGNFFTRDFYGWDLEIFVIRSTHS